MDLVKFEDGAQQWMSGYITRNVKAPVGSEDRSDWETYAPEALHEANPRSGQPIGVIWKSIDLMNIIIVDWIGKILEFCHLSQQPGVMLAQSFRARLKGTLLYEGAAMRGWILVGRYIEGDAILKKDAN